ncbi:MAG: hypothetical protein ACT4R6_14040 [Gemmatimonadaceae bacterium]
MTPTRARIVLGTVIVIGLAVAAVLLNVPLEWTALGVAVVVVVAALWASRAQQRHP